MPDEGLTKRQCLIVLLFPVLVGLVCCVCAVIFAPNDEGAQGLWAMAPFVFIVPAKYLARPLFYPCNFPRKVREQASTFLYSGVALYFVILTVAVCLAEMLG